MSEHPFTPDWCIAPACTLQELMEERDTSLRVLASLCVPYRATTTVAGLSALINDAADRIQEVLDRKPLTPAHAGLLHHGTGVSARFWLALEHNYRAGLAAGLTDVSHDAS